MSALYTVKYRIALFFKLTYPHMALASMDAGVHDMGCK
jgi:hypothetical protein